MIVVSDTHLSPRAAEPEANWDAVLRYVTKAAPDLVIHLGDLSMDGAHDPADLEYARAQLDRLPVPWHAVPGNHDIGDNPSLSAPAGETVDAGRLQRWLDIVGPDRWSLTLNGWTMLGINAQLAGTGLAAETAQWSWLEQRLGEPGMSGQPVALLTHKPVTATAAEMAAAPSYRSCRRPPGSASRTPAVTAGSRSSSAATCISVGSLTSTALITSGCRRRGRCFPTRCSLSSEPSAAGSSRSSSVAAYRPSQSSSSRPASRS